MAALIDPNRLAACKDALSNWRVSGYVQFELTEEAHQWIRQELGLDSPREIARLMAGYVADGGEVDEVVERRAEWTDRYEFHHDFRFKINGKLVYVETRLNYRIPVLADESWILVVNVHAP